MASNIESGSLAVPEGYMKILLNKTRNRWHDVVNDCVPLPLQD